MKITLFSDGGSRGNPGEAAIGYVIKKDNQDLYIMGEPIGIKTNNYAEYMALLKGTKKAISIGATYMDIYLDSELIVKQINGEYKVKNEDLKSIYFKVLEEFRKLDGYKITHIKREFNKEADKALNISLDTKKIYEVSFIEDKKGILSEKSPEEKIEQAICDSGFKKVKINIHDDLIRISIPIDQLEDFLKSEICKDTKLRLIALGYKYITVDLG